MMSTHRRTIAHSCYHSSDTHTDMQAHAQLYDYRRTRTPQGSHHFFVLKPSPSKLRPGSCMAVFAEMSEKPYGY